MTARQKLPSTWWEALRKLYNSMDQLHLKIITPKKVVVDEDVYSVNAPASEGVITVLPHHEHLFTLLAEGVVKIRRSKEGTDEDYLAIGGGYLETDGKNLNILVSRAYGQDEIDEEFTKKAMAEAEKILRETKNDGERHEAAATMRKAIIDMKLIKRKRRV